MTLPTPHEPENTDNKPLSPSPTSSDKPNLKDFDDESNWIDSPTNSAIQINQITGAMRTKDYSYLSRSAKKY
jgi:hypothetical protein